MSFNAKNLSYESNEPAFLRKLRSEYGGSDSARHERPLARPRKAVKDGEDDDQPTYVVEGSQDTLSKAECEALIGVAGDEKQDGNEAALSPQPDHGPDKHVEGAAKISEDAEPAKQKTASIGGSNKRKVAKAVVDEDERPASIAEEDVTRTTKRAKVRKGKKIKLSFDEEASEPPQAQ